jgi:hypothetical protein
MKYKCIRSWARHSIGDVVEEYEYNRLPHEIKGVNFEPLQVVQVVQDVAINPEVSIPAPIDFADDAVEIQEKSRNFIDDPEKTELPTIPIIGEERKKKTWQNKI